MAEPVVLLARSVTGQHDLAALRRVAVALARRRGGLVRVGVLEDGEPALHDVLTELASTGAERVVVVPAHVPADRGLALWGGRAIAHWTEAASAAGGPMPRIDLATGPEFHDGVIDALAAAAHAPSCPPATTAAAFESPAWSAIPPARHHVLLCQGPRCTARGAGAAARELSQRLRERGLGEQDVLLTRTACLFPCNLGPVALVYPEGRWVAPLDARGARALVDHLLPPTPGDAVGAGPDC